MDAVEYLKTKARMTEYCNRCNTCGLSGKNNKSEFGCTFFELGNAEQAVEIVEKWSKEHPVKTYLSVLLEKFPDAEINTENIPTICPNRIFGKSGYNANCDSSIKSCVDCWNREYKEEV